MTIKLEASEAARIKIVLQKAIDIIEQLSQKSCSTCINWLPNGGCSIAEGRIPPEHVQTNGCPHYKNNGVPF